ncbi:MAG: carbohydrate ABC transporter permease [Clostridia bacterium]|nr:carbohydrate ABC transporter permease [Clostridia bacterium]
MVYKNSIGERIFDCFNYIFLTLLVFVTLYPCWYVLVASVSDPVQIFSSNGLLFWPKGFSVSSYGEVIKNVQIWTGYRNTIIYVLAGGFVSVFLTITAAFALTRKGLPGRNIIMFLIMFTMYFAGGLIPTYLVVKAIGLLNSPFAMILVNAVTTYNLIITISYFRGMPDSLEEAAKIDGAGDYTVLFRIMIPLAKPIIAVITLYYAVAIWNNFMTALIYLSDRELYPLQMVLREILIQGNTDSVAATGTGDDAQAYAANLKYAVIVVSTVPILCVYPFIQKYFVKGVMIGAIKG